MIFFYVIFSFVVIIIDIALLLSLFDTTYSAENIKNNIYFVERIGASIGKWKGIRIHKRLIEQNKLYVHKYVDDDGNIEYKTRDWITNMPFYVKKIDNKWLVDNK